MEDIRETNWWKYTDDTVHDLMKECWDLLEMERERIAGGAQRYHDYGFMVFPAAKAYEGFLKKLFLDMGLINRLQYNSDHFRIGRALSPSLPKRYRIGWVYGRLVAACKGDALPLRMWEVWKQARNRVFHYFPHHQECVTFEEAEQLIGQVMAVMEESLAGCGLKISPLG